MVEKADLAEALRKEGTLMMYVNGEWLPFVNIVEFVQAQRDWGYEAFGPNYTGTLSHLKKEIREVEADPDDLEEWIDVILLGMSGALRSGGGRTAEDVVSALVAKYEKNKARKWPDWRTVPAGEAIEHDRTGEKPKETLTCAFCAQDIVFSSYMALGFWEPDVDEDDDPVIWRHKATGYSACGRGSLNWYATPSYDRERP